MAAGQNWTWEETRMAWALYMALPAKEIDDEGSFVRRLAIALGRSPNAVALKAWNIAAHDERRLSKGLKGMGHGGRYDQLVWDEFSERGDAFLEESIALLANTLAGDGYGGASFCDELGLPFGLTKVATVATRVNQSYFRNRLLENYSGHCCLTGLGVEGLLIASHIKPWNVADPATERLSPDNGLLLNSLHDRAFDKGFITIDYNLRIVVSPAVPKDDAAAVGLLWAYDGARITAPSAFPPRREFIEYHNDVVFRRRA